MKWRLCLTAGAFCLFLSGLSVMFNLYEGFMAGRASADVLSVMRSESAFFTPVSDRFTFEEMPVMEIDGLLYIGFLEIKSLGLDLPVLSEWNEEDAKRAPCRYTGSVYSDDLIIAGHNYASHFGFLRLLGPGDAVTFTSVDGTVYDYEVMLTETVPGDGADEIQTGDWDLTLFTCTSGGEDRRAVRCVHVQEK